MPLMIARIKDIDDEDYTEYEIEVPRNLPNSILARIAFGLFFEHEWPIKDTESNWTVE